MSRILPFSLFIHCVFSMWAYGTPEIWPEDVEVRTDSDGEIQYYTENRTFSERLFNENSMPFFILLVILIVLYILELILENYIIRYFFRMNKMVNLEQKRFTELKPVMQEFSETSYDPMLNPEYAKILTSMLDVAEVNKSVDLENIPVENTGFLARMNTTKVAKANVEKEVSTSNYFSC